MIGKDQLMIFGLVTLFGFPAIGWVIGYFIDGVTFQSFLRLDEFQGLYVIVGVFVGIIYAWLAGKILEFKVFDQIPNRMDEMVKSLNLTTDEALLLSLCAGIGEEYLFRGCVQEYLGLIPTAIIFVAIHGYLNPTNWRKSLYGFVVLPLSFALGLAFEKYGIWSAIAIHAAYDFILFYSWSKESTQNKL